MTEALAPVRNLGNHGITATRRIYEGGFADHLRASWDEVYTDRRLDEEALALLVDGEPAGFIMLRALGPTDRIYLRYLVIAADRRGQGLGSLLWEHLRAHCVREDFTLLVWDVEHPGEEGIDDGERSVRERRAAFYERLGGVVIPVLEQTGTEYTNPHLRSDGSSYESPMLLMATPLGPTQLPVDDRTWLSGLVSDVQRYRWERAEMR